MVPAPLRDGGRLRALRVGENRGKATACPDCKYIYKHEIGLNTQNMTACIYLGRHLIINPDIYRFNSKSTLLH